EDAHSYDRLSVVDNRTIILRRHRMDIVDFYSMQLPAGGRADSCATLCFSHGRLQLDYVSAAHPSRHGRDYRIPLRGPNQQVYGESKPRDGRDCESRDVRGYRRNPRGCRYLGSPGAGEAVAGW